MTPNESRSNTNRNQVKLLKSNDLNKTCLNEKWDRLKIVCEQKFNRVNPFGLCFIKLYSPSTLTDETNQTESLNRSTIKMNDDDDDDETSKEQSKIGSFFARKQAEKKINVSEPTASDQIRALSNVAEELLSKKPMDDNEIQTLLKKDTKNTPNRASKRPITSDDLQSPANESETKRSKTENQSQLMKKVVFVLSGFQNPLRTELRTKASKMGATYNDDWDDTCTHLICAFPNTPKYTQVKQSSKGFVVSKQWILDCYKQNQYLSEKNYELKGSSNDNHSITKKETSERQQKKPMTFDDSDDEDNEKPIVSMDVTKKTPVKKKIQTFDDDDLESDDDLVPTTSTKSRKTTQTKKKMTTFDDTDDDDDEPIISKNGTKKVMTLDDDNNVYDAETDEDEPQTSELSNFFHGKHFYVDINEFDESTYHDIRRVIYAYDGTLEKQITSEIKYMITNRLWNDHFDKISKTNPEMKFLSLDWLQDCHDENKFVPCQSYLILPENK
ncbi:hypothetical protein I4U23_006782 [Adineta vaga]|nr:hypothetical protein I4U23_006782 [Adineta vaga]